MSAAAESSSQAHDADDDDARTVWPKKIGQQCPTKANKNPKHKGYQQRKVKAPKSAHEKSTNKR